MKGELKSKTAAEKKSRRGVKSFVTSGMAATEALGMRLAQGLSAGSVVALSGELGAGKTVLARGIARGLGVEGYLKSPSFTIINEYREGRIPLYHIDLYRFPEGGADCGDDGLALEEYLYGDGVCIIEWAERALSLIPDDAIKITITYGGELAEPSTIDAEKTEADLAEDIPGDIDDTKEVTEGSREELGAEDGMRTLVVSFSEYSESCNGKN